MLGAAAASRLLGSFGDCNLRFLPDKALAANGLSRILNENAVGNVDQFFRKVDGFSKKLTKFSKKADAFSEKVVGFSE